MDMPLSARCLYFTLGMLADDDGFVSSPKAIMRQCGASQDDMKVLLAKRYILSFDSGVIVIKHWRINNYLRNDRYQQTTYIEEKETLTTDQKGAYTEIDKLGIPSMGIPSIGKDSIDKDRLDKDINNINNKKFVPPSVDEVKEYCLERKNNVDPEAFVSFYESKGWMVGKNKMKDWKAAVRTWERSRSSGTGKAKPDKPQFGSFSQREYDFDELRKIVSD